MKEFIMGLVILAEALEDLAVQVSVDLDTLEDLAVQVLVDLDTLEDLAVHLASVDLAAHLALDSACHFWVD